MCGIEQFENEMVEWKQPQNKIPEIKSSKNELKLNRLQILND